MASAVDAKRLRYALGLQPPKLFPAPAHHLNLTNWLSLTNIDIHQ
jgi:hypothetical protein